MKEILEAAEKLDKAKTSSYPRSAIYWEGDELMIRTQGKEAVKVNDA